MKKLRSIILKLFIISLFIQHNSYSQIYVQDGDDIISIINNITPNTTIYVSDGNYNGGVITNSGNITLIGSEQSFFNSKIYINADNFRIKDFKWLNVNGFLIEIRGKNNLISKCEFSGFGNISTSKAIWIRNEISVTDNHSNNVIDNCIFKNWGKTSQTGSNSCVKVGQTNPSQIFQGTIIRNNKFIDGPLPNNTENQTAIQLFCPTLVENNIIKNSYDAIEVKGSNNIIRKNIISECHGAEILSNRSGSNNIFEGNIIHDNENEGIHIWSGENNIFRNNIVYNCKIIARIKGAKYNLDGTISDTEANNVSIYNNTFYNNERGIIWDPGNGNPLNPPQNIKIVNNIFFGMGINSAIENTYFNPSVTKCSNNLFYNFSSNYIPQGNSIITQNPMFNTSTNDFQIQSISPCIDAGQSVQPFVENDINGNHRPLNGVSSTGIRIFDIGAHEYFTNPNECELINLIIENQIIFSDKEEYKDIYIRNSSNNTDISLIASNKIIINPNTNINFRLKAEIDVQCTSYFINLSSNMIKPNHNTLEINNTVNKGNRIIISPNPSNGYFSITYSVKNQNGRVLIYDKEKKLIFETENVLLNTMKVNINEHPSDIYYVKVITNNETLVQKVLVRN